MKINYNIKELTKEDLKSLNGFLETLENLSKVGEMSIDEAREFLSKINSQDGHIYIAQKDDEQIIGATTLLIEQKFIHKGCKVGHIEDVATRKGYEGMGVGSAVVMKAIDEAKKFGCYRIILDCKDDLILFYKKFGFYKHENCMRLDLQNENINSITEI